MGNIFYKKGVSLVELIIYVAIFVTVAGLMTGIFVNFVGIQSKESAGAEVTSQMNFVLQKIQSAVKDSSNIEISTSSVTSNLKLRTPNSSSTDPTCIYLSSGKVRIVQGPDNANPLLASQNCKADSEASDLTNDKVIVDKLEFKKSSFGVGHDTVAVDMQMTYNVANERMRVTRTLQSAIARVSAATFDSDLIPSSAYNFSLGQSAKGWGNIYVGDGAAGTPSYTFGSQTNMGIFKAATNVLGFTTQGIERMRIDGSGNVGIGTTAPGSKLQISAGNSEYLPSTSAFSIRKNEEGYGLFAGVAGSGNGWLQAGTSNDATNYNLVLQSRGGNVGIGTTNPTSKLSINDGGIRFTGTAAYGAGSDSGIMGTGGAGGSYLSFITNGNQQMRIDSSGNVGIGTTGPGNYGADRKLAIYDSGNAAGITLAGGTSSYQGLYFADGTSGSDAYRGYVQYQHATDDMRIGVAGAEAMRILNNSNVGIGTTNPDAPLHANGGAAMTAGWNRTATLQATFPVLVFNSGSSKWAGIGYDFSTAMRFYINAPTNDVSAGTGTLNILNNGNIGVGANNPGAKLQVSGGDVYLDTVDRGMILRTPDGTKCYRVRIDNNGALSTMLITCP